MARSCARSKARVPPHRPPAQHPLPPKLGEEGQGDGGAGPAPRFRLPGYESVAGQKQSAGDSWAATGAWSLLVPAQAGRSSWILRSSTGLGTAPTTLPTTSPSLKNSTVGIDRTLNWMAVRWFASTSSFPTTTEPAYCSASCSTAGAISRHGPHHSAQKSTIDNPVAPAISDSKFASVISFTFSLVAISIIPWLRSLLPMIRGAVAPLGSAGYA